MTVTRLSDVLGSDERVELFDGLTFLGHRWWFRIVDTGNNEGLATGQTYKTMIQRDKTANRLARAMGCPVVEGKRK